MAEYIVYKRVLRALQKMAVVVLRSNLMSSDEHLQINNEALKGQATYHFPEQTQRFRAHRPVAAEPAASGAPALQSEEYHKHTRPHLTLFHLCIGLCSVAFYCVARENVAGTWWSVLDYIREYGKGKRSMQVGTIRLTFTFQSYSCECPKTTIQHILWPAINNTNTFKNNIFSSLFRKEVKRIYRLVIDCSLIVFS